MTANTGKIKAMCKCQRTFALSWLSSDGEDTWTEDKFTGVPNMHEIDEDSETEGEATASAQPGPSVADKEKNTVVQETENASPEDYESAYAGESFCSDESCDESEAIDVSAPRSPVSDSSSPPCTTNLERNVKPADAGASAALNSLRLRLRNDEFDGIANDDELPCTVAADRFVKLRRHKRWNMTFTDEEMRRIERENELLLRKIMAQQKPRHKAFEERIVQSKTSSSAINRRKLQKKIDDDNMVYNSLRSWTYLK